MLKVEPAEDGAVFWVRVQPRASRSEVAGVVDGVLKLRLTSPPVEGEANRQCVRFLADLLGVSRSRVHLLRGEHSREKQVKVDGMTVDKILEIIFSGT